MAANNFFDIIIIGAGPAGMTAALYGCRAGKSILVLEGSGIGGQIAFSPMVENYPAIKRISGMELADALFTQITDAGANLSVERVLSVEENTDGTKTVTTEDGIYLCRCVIIATGVGHRPLGLTNEKDFVGKGLSYCALCDGPYYKDGVVAVVGGGNTALGDSLILSNYCKKVYLIHRKDTFSGEPALLSRLKERENVEIITPAYVDQLFGTESLKAIALQNTADLSLRKIDVDCLFVAVGHMPQNEIFFPLCAIDEAGYIVTNDLCQTSASGIFAAGDCRAKQIRQLTTAVSDGTIAATLACKHIDSLAKK